MKKKSWMDWQKKNQKIEDRGERRRERKQQRKTYRDEENTRKGTGENVNNVSQEQQCTQSWYQAQGWPG